MGLQDLLGLVVSVGLLWCLLRSMLRAEKA
jgi:hypothetical protein